MDILVLLKQVPATESMVSIAPDNVSIKTDGLKYVINPYDELAVEEALKIREAQGGTVTILSAGEPKAAEAIRTALAMGADKGVLIDVSQLKTDGLGVARLLAAAAKTLPHDLILAGHRAVDDDNFLVGPAAAEYLGIAVISMATQVQLADGAVTCRCAIEGGTKEVKAALPALITTTRGLNEPRYASLPGIMKAKKKPLETKTPADFGLDADALKPLVSIKGMSLPPERKGGRIIEGETAQAKAAALVKALHEEAKVI
ncbi:MAG: electron transfer flavoprotein subunit beta/FixA family protein [Desulfosarcinaceae bacterium]